MSLISMLLSNRINPNRSYTIKVMNYQEARENISLK